MKLNVVVTGGSNGMGKAYIDWLLVLENECEIYNIDIVPSGIESSNFHEYICDVSDYDSLPDIANVHVLVNNAGVQNGGRDIDVNLKGVINCTKKYGLQPSIKSILNQASVSAHNGAEFGEYTASKGGVLAYTIWTAKEIAKYGATCNSLSFGGVLTDLNKSVIENEEMWNEIMEMTPLKKWVKVEEAADWMYQLTFINKSMTGQDLIIDNGEFFNHKFVW